jgi:hypothetical protein
LVYWRIHENQEFYFEYNSGNNWGRLDMLYNFLVNINDVLTIAEKNNYLKIFYKRNTIQLFKQIHKKNILKLLFKYRKYTLFSFKNTLFLLNQKK